MYGKVGQYFFPQLVPFFLPSTTTASSDSPIFYNVKIQSIPLSFKLCPAISVSKKPKTKQNILPCPTKKNQKPKQNQKPNKTPQSIIH